MSMICLYYRKKNMKKNGIVSVMTFSNKERLSKLFGELFSYKFKKWNLEKMKDSEFILISYERLIFNEVSVFNETSVLKDYFE